jgi:pimeloyl-ACP methyl ester carboxylesterase
MDFEQVATARIGSLNVARLGDGDPLVLLHGVLRGWKDYASVLPQLAEHHQLMAADFRGHGESDRTPGKYRVVDYVEDGVKLVQASAGRPVVYGHSLGAMVAAAVAAEMPDQVRAVILEDPPFETMGARIADSGLLSYMEDLQKVRQAELPVPQLIEAMAEIRIVPPGSTEQKRLGDVRTPAALNFAGQCLANLDPEVLTPIVQGEWLRGYDLAGVLSRIQCPVLLMQGNVKLGALLSDDDVRLAKQLLPRCTFVRFDNVGHHLHTQQPEQTLSVINTFIAELE